MRALIFLSALAGALAGCQSLECADGTFDNDGTCVGYDPNDKTPPVVTLDPAGGRTRNPIPEVVQMTTDEVARIFYTTDGTDPDPNGTGETSPVAVVGVKQGTTLKYFAIDRAGNRSETVTTTFDSDTKPPAPVSGLALVLAATTANVSWTNPNDSDYAGTMIARVTDAIDVDPSPGVTYTAGMALSPSLQIVSVGKATAVADPGRPAGPVRYVAWTYDDLGNYSLPVAVKDAVPLGSLAAQFTYDTANQTLTLVTPPDNLDLAGSTATLAGTTLTLNLSVKNNSAQYFQNMKAEVASVTGGAFGNSDGTADALPFKSLGPTVVAPGATVTKQLTFTGAQANTTVTINLTLAQHNSLVSAYGRSLQQVNLIDLGSNAILAPLATTSRGPNDRVNGRIRPPILVGGRYLDIPTTHNTIERWDLTTRTFKTSLAIAGDAERVNVVGLYATPTSTLALVKYAGRRRTGTAEVLRIDEGLHITGRLAMPAIADRGHANAAVSADGSLLAVPLQSGIALVDTATLTLVDAEPLTQFSVDMINPGFTGGAKALQFFNNTAGLLAINRFGGAGAIIRRNADGYTVTPYQDASTSTRGCNVVTAPDGKVWFVFQSGIRAFDPATGTVSNITYGQVPNGIGVVDGKLWVIRSDRITLDQVSTAGAIQKTVTMPAGTGAYGHWLETVR